MDESQNISIFQKVSTDKVAEHCIYKIVESIDMDDTLRKKDLFGMGYPYFISYYYKYIAVTSDYGVLFFEI